MYHTYILECADGSLYTGWTNDVPARVEAHNQGKGAKYTRARLPVALAAVFNFDSKSEAMTFEYRIKQMTRSMKEKLIAANKKSS